MMNNKYYHHKYTKVTRSHYGAEEAKAFLMKKCKWSTTVFKSIAWKQSASVINNQSQPTKRTMIKFIHRLLYSGKRNRDEALICSYYK